MSRQYHFIGLIAVLLLSFSGALFAQDSLGGVSDNVLGPVSILQNMFSVASILAGVAFLISAFFRYLRHRKNPQESPISTVILWVLLGLLLVGLGFIHDASTVAAHQQGVTWVER